MLSHPAGRRHAVAAALLAVGLHLGAQAPAPPDTAQARADLQLLRRADAARTRGLATGARIDTLRPTIHEFVDYACPDCRDFAQTRGDSLHALGSAARANVVHRVAPIPRLLRGVRAAEAAFCAGGLGDAAAFAAMERRLFETQATWRAQPDPTAVFVAHAAAIGVDSSAFARCLRVGVTAPLVAADLRLAGRLGVEGTPTLIVTPAGALTAGVPVLGDPSMATLGVAVREAATPVAPDPDAVALLGRWRVDSLAVLAWRPARDTAEEAARREAARSVSATLADVRRGALRIETHFTETLAFTHRLQRGDRVVYEERGSWRLPAGSVRLATRRDDGAPGTNDGAQLVGRDGTRLVLERAFTTGRAAGMSERIYLAPIETSGAPR
ncbi:MAG: DsbA family protein [Gemmatimonadaceae bacterium]|nr:DsbA family protein [Gemmatimonadaceae bacterium]